MRRFFPFQRRGGTARLAISADARACVHDEGVVLLDLRRGAFFTSNRVGAAVWKGLEDGIGIPEIAVRLAREFGVTVEHAARDASRFCTELEARNLLLRESL